MKKTTKTLLTMLLLTGSTFGIAYAKITNDGAIEKEKVEVLTKEQGLYNLVYKTSNSGRYNVNIYDASGKKVFTDYFSCEKSFSKVYNFKNLAHGTYTMEVVSNSSEKVVKEIVYNSSSSFHINLSPVEDGKKYNLVVTGVDKNPVRVVIMDSYERQLYDEVINVKSDFQQSYDLSSITAANIKFRVIHNGRAIEKNVEL